MWQCRQRGFTLIETVVVLAISVGLVVLTSLLFRSVGQAALALGGDRDEWMLQRQLRQQLAHGFVASNLASRVLIGEPDRLVFFTWRSRIFGADGKPVLAEYRFDPSRRALLYRELPLPAWWDIDRAPRSPGDLLTWLERVPEAKLVGGLESLTFAYLPASATSAEAEQLRDSWRETAPPRLVFAKYAKGARDIELWLALRATHG
jgi:prepilin-type N-terminal cleavage/methylation domain-containing protein